MHEYKYKSCVNEYYLKNKMAPYKYFDGKISERLFDKIQTEKEKKVILLFAGNGV